MKRRLSVLSASIILALVAFMPGGRERRVPSVRA